MWAHCIIEHAQKPHPFYPKEFQTAAAAIQERDFNLCEQYLSLENAELIYMHLISTCTVFHSIRVH